MISKDVLRDRIARGVKWCSACKCEHGLESFGANRAKLDGFNSMCKESSNQKSRAYKAKRFGAPLTVEQRFWAKVEKGEECWEWSGGRYAKGYGAFRFNGKNQTATRVLWQWLHGPIPEGMFVLHRCDNPPCVRPDHLFLGTHGDNMQDCISKGRYKVTSIKGKDHWNYKHGNRVGKGHPKSS